MSRICWFNVVWQCVAFTRLIGVLGTWHGRVAVERGMALLVGGMFCDEVAAAVNDTCCGPIMLMRSSGGGLVKKYRVFVPSISSMGVFANIHWVVGAAGGHVQDMLV